jgi:hypothetical protein
MNANLAVADAVNQRRMGSTNVLKGILRRLVFLPDPY